MSKENIHILIERWLNGSSTPQEKEQLQQYFIQYGLTEDQIREESAHYPNAAQSKKMYAFLTEALELEHRPVKIYQLSRKWWLRAAAVVLPLILMATGMVYLAKKQPAESRPGYVSAIQQIINDGSEPRSFRLADGSTVWLNKNASLQLDTLRFTQARNITLQGEAYFEVAHDTAHPFTVMAGGLATKVLGTSFTIKSDTLTAATSVTLFTGKVALKTSQGGTALLNPGQAAFYNSRSSKLDTGPASVYALAWKTKEIICKNESFEHIIGYLETYYGTKINHHPAIGGKRFSGTLSLRGDVSAVLDRLLFVHQLQFKKSGENRIDIY